MPGVEVWEDRLDNWVGTLPIWNQHTYHVTNVNLGRFGIPSPEPPNWTTPAGNPENSYRRNGQGALSSLCARQTWCPSDLEVDLAAVPRACTCRARVLNQGCLGVGPGVNVSFYETTLGLLGTAQTQNGDSRPVAPKTVTLDRGRGFARRGALHDLPWSSTTTA